MKGGAHVDMESPRLNEDAVQLLQDPDEGVHSLGREELNNCKVPFQVFLLTCTEKETNISVCLIPPGKSQLRLGHF